MTKPENKIFIITGEQGEGKTSCLIEVIKSLKLMGIKMNGFFAEGFWDNGLRSGFDLVDLNTGDKFILCKSSFEKNYQKLGRFYFNPTTIKYGEEVLNDPDMGNDKLIVIDEIGLFELRGNLWSQTLINLLNNKSNPLLLTVRTDFVEEVISKFNLTNYRLFQLTESASEIAKQIHNNIK